MNSNSIYGFDTFDRNGTMYCSAAMGVDGQTSAIHSALDNIDADKVYYNGASLNEVLTSLSNSFNHLQENAIQVGNSLSGAVDNIKVKSRLKRKDLKTLRYGV